MVLPKQRQVTRAEIHPSTRTERTVVRIVGYLTRKERWRKDFRSQVVCSNAGRLADARQLTG